MKSLSEAIAYLGGYASGPAYPPIHGLVQIKALLTKIDNQLRALDDLRNSPVDHDEMKFRAKLLRIFGTGDSTQKMRNLINSTRDCGEISRITYSHLLSALSDIEEESK